MQERQRYDYDCNILLQNAIHWLGMPYLYLASWKHFYQNRFQPWNYHVFGQFR